MKITVLGPNLSTVNSAKGALHAHESSCLDIKRRYKDYEQATSDTIEAESIVEIVTAMYDPSDFAYDPNKPEEYGGFRNDVYIAPCVNLPEGLPYE